MHLRRAALVGSFKLLLLASCAGAACYCYPKINEQACDGEWIDLWRTVNGEKCPDRIIQNGSARTVEVDLGAGATELGTAAGVSCVIERYVCNGTCTKLPNWDITAKQDQNLQGEQCGTGPCLPQAPGGND